MNKSNSFNYENVIKHLKRVQKKKILWNMGLWPHLLVADMNLSDTDNVKIGSVEILKNSLHHPILDWDR